MATASPDLNKLGELVSKSEAYAFVLDYALFGSHQASIDGGFSTQAQIIPNFQESLSELLASGFITMKTSHRYTGSAQYPEVSVDREEVLHILDGFYQKLRTNLEFLNNKIEHQPQDFFKIYANREKVFFGEYESDGIESLCKELIQKGLMLGWDWITRAHQYRCYKFRDQPFNVADEFIKSITGKLREYFKTKIESYLQDGYAARLDYLLGLAQTKNTVTVTQYMKDRGWSEKVAWEAKNALRQEGIPVEDTSTPQFKLIEDEVSKISETVNELVQVTKPQELNKFKITLRKQGELGKTKVEFADVVNLIESSLPKLKSNDIEVLGIDRSENWLEVKISCNRLLYSLRVDDSDVYALPTGNADKMIVVGKKVLDYPFNQFMEKPLPSLLLVGYQDFSMLGSADSDVVFRFVLEQFRTNGIFLLPQFERIFSFYQKASEALKASLSLNEGFVFTEPHIPWLLQQEFLKVLGSTTNNIKLIVPYPDSSTFSFLAAAPKNVFVRMIILSDAKELKEKKMIGIDVLDRTVRGRRMEVKRNTDIHIRFIIADDRLIMFSSSDLKDTDLKRKYQYGFWTNNDSVVKNVVQYFETVWQNSVPIDLFSELKD